MSDLTEKILARAKSQPLCNVAVIGVLPDGGGLYLDWTGKTTSSLVQMCQAAIQEATAVYVDGLKSRDEDAA